MRILKKILLALGVLIVISIGLNWIYYFAYSGHRRFIRQACETLKSGDPLDLKSLQTLMEKEGARLYYFELNKPVDLPSDIKKHIDQLNPQEIKSLFFLADGIRRESLSITVRDGLMTEVHCSTNKGFFNR